MKTPRWETFSDGVFAIAVTLLILEIKVPHEGDLVPGLVAVWPSVAAYVASFLYIGTWWMSHHFVGERLETVDGGALLINVVFLMTISFIPFPTAVLADRVTSGHETGTAAAFYAAAMLLTALVGNLFAEYALRRGLFGRRLAEIGSFLRYRWVGPALYAASIPLALALPLAALAFFVISPVFYGAIFVRRHFVEGQ